LGNAGVKEKKGVSHSIKTFERIKKYKRQRRKKKRAN